MSIAEIGGDVAEAKEFLCHIERLIDRGLSLGIHDKTLRRRVERRVAMVERCLADIRVRCAGWEVER